MKKNPLLKRIGTLLFCSSISSFSFSQAVEKTSLITYYDYPDLQTRTSYVTIGIGADKNLKLYGSQFIPGKLKNANEKEKSFSTFSGNDMQRGLNLYSERSISANLDSLNSQQILIVSNESASQALKFEVATVADIASKGLPKDFDVIAYSKAIENFPSLKPEESVETRKLLGAEFKVQGKGLFGVKEPKAYPVFTYSQPLEVPTNATETNNKITASSLFKIKSFANTGNDKSNEDAPRKEQNMGLLDGYIGVYESKPILTTKDQKIFNGVLGQKNEDDKWSEYRNIAFVTFDDKGNILQKDTIAFQYIRRTYFSSVVKDFSGNEKGFVYFFGGLVTIGGKKEKDPMENNFQIVYMGLDGKIKYKNTFQRGIPTNKMGLSPIMVVEKDGKLLVWNVRTDKALAESSAEILEFDEKGTMSVKIEKAEILAASKASGATLNSYADFGRLVDKPIKTMYDNGKVTIVRQMKERKTRDVPNSVGGTSKEEYFEYGNIAIMTFENNDKLPEVRMIPLATSFQPADNNMLDESEKHFNSIITAGNNNFFVSFKDYNLTTMLVNVVKEKEMPLFIPERNIMKYNYVIDKDNKKAYFVYATPSKRLLKLIKVGY